MLNKELILKYTYNYLYIFFFFFLKKIYTYFFEKKGFNILLLKFFSIFIYFFFKFNFCKQIHLKKKYIKIENWINNNNKYKKYKNCILIYNILKFNKINKFIDNLNIKNLKIKNKFLKIHINELEYINQNYCIKKKKYKKKFFFFIFFYKNFLKKVIYKLTKRSIFFLNNLKAKIKINLILYLYFKLKKKNINEYFFLNKEIKYINLRLNKEIKNDGIFKNINIFIFLFNFFFFFFNDLKNIVKKNDLKKKIKNKINIEILFKSFNLYFKLNKNILFNYSNLTIYKKFIFSFFINNKIENEINNSILFLKNKFIKKFIFKKDYFTFFKYNNMYKNEFIIFFSIFSCKIMKFGKFQKSLNLISNFFFKLKKKNIDKNYISNLFLKKVLPEFGVKFYKKNKKSRKKNKNIQGSFFQKYNWIKSLNQLAFWLKESCLKRKSKLFFESIYDEIIETFLLKSNVYFKYLSALYSSLEFFKIKKKRYKKNKLKKKKKIKDLEFLSFRNKKVIKKSINKLYKLNLRKFYSYINKEKSLSILKDYFYLRKIRKKKKLNKKILRRFSYFYIKNQKKKDVKIKYSSKLKKKDNYILNLYNNKIKNKLNEKIKKNYKKKLNNKIIYNLLQNLEKSFNFLNYKNKIQNYDFKNKFEYIYKQIINKKISQFKLNKINTKEIIKSIYLKKFLNENFFIQFFLLKKFKLLNYKFDNKLFFNKYIWLNYFLNKKNFFSKLKLNKTELFVIKNMSIRIFLYFYSVEFLYLNIKNKENKKVNKFKKDACNIYNKIFFISFKNILKNIKKLFNYYFYSYIKEKNEKAKLKISFSFNFFIFFDLINNDLLLNIIKNIFNNLNLYFLLYINEDIKYTKLIYNFKFIANFIDKIKKKTYKKNKSYLNMKNIDQFLFEYMHIKFKNKNENNNNYLIDIISIYNKIIKNNNNNLEKIKYNILLDEDKNINNINNINNLNYLKEYNFLNLFIKNIKKEFIFYIFNFIRNSLKIRFINFYIYFKKIKNIYFFYKRKKIYIFYFFLETSINQKFFIKIFKNFNFINFFKNIDLFFFNKYLKLNIQKIIIKILNFNYNLLKNLIKKNIYKNINLKINLNLIKKYFFEDFFFIFKFRKKFKKQFYKKINIEKIKNIYLYKFEFNLFKILIYYIFYLSKKYNKLKKKIYRKNKDIYQLFLKKLNYKNNYFYYAEEKVNKEKKNKKNYWDFFKILEKNKELAFVQKKFLYKNFFNKFFFKNKINTSLYLITNKIIQDKNLFLINYNKIIKKINYLFKFIKTNNNFYIKINKFIYSNNKNLIKEIINKNNNKLFLFKKKYLSIKFLKKIIKYKVIYKKELNKKF